MENPKDWEQNPIVNELTQGRDLAKLLRIQLGQPASNETRDLLLEKILSSFDKALLLLKWTGSEPIEAIAGMLESPHSMSESPGSEDSDQEHRDISKKRKTIAKWVARVRISPGTTLEGALDDSYSWRKYGQKDILGAKYPRGYYRCTHRNVQGCLATKQVQRTDEDPSILEITYRGKHTCIQASSHFTTAPVPAPAPAPAQERVSPEQQNPPLQIQKQEASKEIFLNFQTGLSVKTQDLNTSYFSFPSTSLGSAKAENNIFSPLVIDNNNNNNNNNFMGSFSTSQPNYFSVSPCQATNYGGTTQNFQTSESELTEIISAATSITNSPIIDVDFKIDPTEFDPNFPFDNSGYF